MTEAPPPGERFVAFTTDGESWALANGAPLRPSLDDLLARAVSGGRSRAAVSQQQLRNELVVAEADLVKTEEAIEPHLFAFETGSMPEATCRQRVQALAQKAAELSEHRADLNAESDMTDTGPTQEDIEPIRTRVTKTVKHEDAAAQKDLRAALVHDIQATGRNDIRPVFKIPRTTTATESRPPHRQGFGSCMDRCPRQDSNLRPAA
jgi:hypothetical protein